MNTMLNGPVTLIEPGMATENEQARTVIKLPELFRAALRAESQERGCDMGDIVAELIAENPSLMAVVERIRKRREAEKKRKN